MIPFAMNPMGRSRNGGSGGVVPLTLTAVTAGATVRLDAIGSPTVSGLQYRTGAGEWSSYTPGTTITLANVGDYVQFQNTENTLSTGTSNYVRFVMAGTVAGSGNIQSMLNYSDACQEYCYYYMFQGRTGLTTAPDLPATTLATGCYRYMFNGCTGLTTAPELPATTLAASCYYYMFYGCTGLTTAPDLPATTLADSCYYSMFRGCIGLTTAPDLPATTLATSCYRYMFYNCTGLTTAPDLPATTLAASCYYGMFYGCTNLNSVTVRLTSWTDTSYTNNWLYGVSASGTFTCPAGLTVPERSASGVPAGWTIVRV